MPTSLTSRAIPSGLGDLRGRRRWLAGLALVVVGWLLSPNAVPIYDGIGQPDEPYRYVAPPPGATRTAGATAGGAQTPVTAGRNLNGLSVQTKEQGPQFSVFLPQGSLASPTGPITISIEPEAPAAAPPGAVIDGNVYLVTFATPASAPVTLTEKAAIATLYLRSTSQRTPQPTMYYRPTTDAAWRPLTTTAGGLDLRVASFVGAGEYAVARVPSKDGGGGKRPVLPLLLIGALVVLSAVVLAVRLRAGGAQE
jgi:hypothetical protein